jgi:hypothetical protein
MVKRPEQRVWGNRAADSSPLNSLNIERTLCYILAAGRKRFTRIIRTAPVWLDPENEAKDEGSNNNESSDRPADGLFTWSPLLSAFFSAKIR